MGTLGLKRVRITGGGEPLLRPDIVDLVAGLASGRIFDEVTMATNGALLPSFVERLKDAGLDRLLITIPSLDKDVFTSIAGSDGLAAALAGLDAALERQIPVTIKMTIHAEATIDGIERMMDFAVERRTDLFVEDPFKCDGDKDAITSGMILARLESKFKLEKIEAKSKPGARYSIKGTDTHLKLLTSDIRRTCGTCDRFWLSPDGVLSVCTGVLTQVSLNAFFEEDPSDEELAQWCVKIAMAKPMHRRSACSIPRTPSDNPAVSFLG